MDKISKRLQYQFQFSYLLELLLTNARVCGYQVTMKELLRTEAQQLIYFKEKKTKTMDSQHLKGLAVDLCFFKDGTWLTTYEDLKSIGQYWQGLDAHCRWGGDWNRELKQSSFYDGLHFEYNSNWGD